MKAKVAALKVKPETILDDIDRLCSLADMSSALDKSATTILGAAKFTGKTADGWSVGVLDAVTGREQARWVSGDDRGVQDVEPLTNYFVARAFRDAGRAGLGFDAGFSCHKCIRRIRGGHKGLRIYASALRVRPKVGSLPW